MARKSSSAREKMCPVIAAYKYTHGRKPSASRSATWRWRARAIPRPSTRQQDAVNSDEVLLSRIVVNQVCATMNGGSFFNSLNPTTTLGCGSWGNNSISENLTYKHLINISRIAYLKPNAVQPSDDEIWG